MFFLTEVHDEGHIDYFLSLYLRFLTSDPPKKKKKHRRTTCTISARFVLWQPATRNAKERITLVLRPYEVYLLSSSLSLSLYIHKHSSLVQASSLLGASGVQPLRVVIDRVLLPSSTSRNSNRGPQRLKFIIIFSTENFVEERKKQLWIQEPIVEARKCVVAWCCQLPTRPSLTW